MPDAPKHISCINNGFSGQFYRMAGSMNYKCKSCNVIMHHTEFEPIEFDWKTNFKAWREFVDQEIKDTGKKVVKEIEKVAKQ